ncbi:hypothetical protein C8Q74DRAFT_1366604 [Fomes fomentarius]|nr:hypothetical protein C8Q74DRAFT_1366604 [Fomes fomentarius]
MAVPPPPGPSPLTDASSAFLDMTIGVIMVGMIVTSSLYGGVIAQAIWYFRHYARDRTLIRWMVGVVCGLDTLSLAFYAASMWQDLVRKELLSSNSAAIPWTSNAQIVCNACAILLIQSFYMFRIWSLSKNNIVVAILMTFVAGDFAFGLLLFVKSIQTKSIEQFADLTPFDIALSSLTAVTDVVLSGTLVTLLARSRTGNTGSNRLINRLLLYTINTGLLTSFCSVVSLITVIVFPNTSVYVMFYYIGSRMYTVSLLSTLNARQGLRLAGSHWQQYGNLEGPGVPHPTTSRSRPFRRSEDGEGRKRSASTGTPRREIVVSVHRDTTVTFEEEDVLQPRETFRNASRYKSRARS